MLIARYMSRNLALGEPCPASKGTVRLKPNFMNPLSTIDEFKIRRKK